jgi:hypothetical protein
MVDGRHIYNYNRGTQSFVWQVQEVLQAVINSWVTKALYFILALMLGM